MKRIIELQKQMNRGGIDLIIAMNPRDVYYYTGTGQPANLIVPKSGETFLQIRRAWDFAVREARLPESQLLKGGSLSQVEALVSRLPFPVRTIGITMDAVPAALYKKIQNAFASCSVLDASPLILRQRSIKDQDEMDLLRTAARSFEYVHETVLKFLRPGISELQLSAKILEAVREHGGDSIIRNRRWDASLPPDGLVVSSKNSWRISGHAMTVTGKGLSPSLPWGASDTTISKGDLVVVDIGLSYRGYHGDVARTYVVGKADSRQQEIFEFVLLLQKTAMSAIKNGVRAKEVYQKTYQKAVELKIEWYFQGYSEMQGNYIGHGLGLELDEPPTLQLGSSVVLASGMALAIEPKLIIPEWGAIELEDDVFVTENGCELISTVPRELFEVE